MKTNVKIFQEGYLFILPVSPSYPGRPVYVVAVIQQQFKLTKIKPEVKYTAMPEMVLVYVQYIQRGGAFPDEFPAISRSKPVGGNKMAEGKPLLIPDKITRQLDGIA